MVSTATLLLLLLLLLLPVLLLLYYYFVRPTTFGPGTHMVLEPRFRLAPVPRVHIAQLLQIGCPHGPYLIPVRVQWLARVFLHVSVFVMLVPLFVAQALEYHYLCVIREFE